jgi:hypothetical protein
LLAVSDSVNLIENLDFNFLFGMIMVFLQDMQDMRNCYDSLLFAAAATANSAYGKTSGLSIRSLKLFLFGRVSN